MGGLYGTGATSEIDGRLLAAASRFRRVSNAIKTLKPSQVVTLHAYAMHRLTGVMLASRVTHDLHRESRSKRALPDWLNRIERTGSSAWCRIRDAAKIEAERAITAFDAKWRRM